MDGRANRLEIRLGKGDKDLICERAQARGVLRAGGQPDMTKYVLLAIQEESDRGALEPRRIALAQLTPDTVLVPDHLSAVEALTREVRSVGILLNQVAQGIHTANKGRGGYPEPERLADAIGKADLVLQVVTGLLRAPAAEQGSAILPNRPIAADKAARGRATLDSRPGA